MIVRYADDFVLGFQNRGNAVRFCKDVQARRADYGWALHAEKTRRIEFGRFAAANRARRGEGQPAALDFLGFTQYWGKTRAGRSQLGRKPIMEGVRPKLKRIQRQMPRALHADPKETARWLGRVMDRWLKLLRPAEQFPAAEVLPGRHEAALGARAASEVAEGTHPLGAAFQAVRAGVATGHDPTPMAESEVRR